MPVQPAPRRPPGLPRRTRTFTGRVIVRLARPVVSEIVEALPERTSISLEEVAGSLGVPELREVLADLGQPPTHRLIRQWSVEKVAQREDAVDPGARFGPLRSLNAYYVLDLRGRTLPELRRAVAVLRQLPQVRNAFVEPPAEVASPVTADALTGRQGYLRGDHTAGSDKSGVNAAAVWNSYDGSGVNLVVLERGWQAKHPDLPLDPDGQPLDVLDPAMIEDQFARAHGTATLGVVAAVDQGDGIVGVGSGVTIPGLVTPKYAGGTAWEVADAVLAAVDALGPGDVLLLELQTVSTVVNGVQLPSGYPLEIVDPWLDAIRLAVLHGITVVEPAGNPAEGLASYDLDSATWSPVGGDPRSLDVGDLTFVDSGAVMVGACASEPVTSGVHPRLTSHWYGSRIDCYAWGQDVYTTTCSGSLPSGEFKFTCPDGVTPDWTYGDYSGTSSASAVVAGVAAVVQQMHRAVLSTSASPGKLRSILSDPSNGTPISDVGGLSRVMPDLKKIATGLSALPDIYIRDSLDDVGAVPSPKVSMSPDVFVRTSPLGLPNPGSPYDDWSVMIPNDLVVPDADNHIYLRISNLSPAAAAPGVDATVFWTPPSSLVLPADWTRIGALPAPVDVPADGRVIAGPITWRPSSADLPFGGHGCFIAQLHHPQDPRPIPAPDLLTAEQFLAFVGSSNNVAWRNFNVVEAETFDAQEAFDLPAEWEGAGFFMRGLPEIPTPFDVRISVRDAPDGAKLFWRMSAAAHGVVTSAVQADSLPVRQDPQGRMVVEVPTDRTLYLQGLRFDADARWTMSLGLFVPAGVSSAPARLVVRQLYGPREVGRITWWVDPGGGGDEVGPS